MTEDHRSMLQGIESPDPPAGLIDAARSRAARMATSGSGRRSRRVAAVTLGIALLTGVLFSPPGQAATDWAADLAGFGGEPTVEPKHAVPGSAVVVASGKLSDGPTASPDAPDGTVASGKLSDGTPYEVVAKRIEEPAARCIHVGWPETPNAEQDSWCAGERNRSGAFAESTYGLWSPPGAGPRSPALFLGITGNPDVESVRVLAREASGGEPKANGTEREIPSTFVRIEGELRDRVGAEEPFGVWVGQLSEDLIAAGRKGDAIVYAVAFDDAGNKLGRVEELSRLARPEWFMDDCREEIREAIREGRAIRTPDGEPLVPTRQLDC